jgi:hypothetical protein
MQQLADELASAPGFLQFAFPLSRKDRAQFSGDVRFDAHCAQPYYVEELRVGAHVAHAFRFSGPVTPAFLMARFAAWREMWERDLNKVYGVFALSLEQRLQLAFEAPDEWKGLAECAVCFERTALKTNCFNGGRRNPHPMCAECIAQAGKCPYSCVETMYDALDDMDDPPPKFKCSCCAPLEVD